MGFTQLPWWRGRRWRRGRWWRRGRRRRRWRRRRRRRRRGCRRQPHHAPTVSVESTPGAPPYDVRVRADKQHTPRWVFSEALPGRALGGHQLAATQLHSLSLSLNSCVGRANSRGEGGDGGVGGGKWRGGSSSGGEVGGRGGATGHRKRCGCQPKETSNTSVLHVGPRVPCGEEQNGANRQMADPLLNFAFTTRSQC